MVKKGPFKVEANPATTTTPPKSSGIASENCSPSTLRIVPTNTPRFTIEEKNILYSLFQQYEYVIDIKNRKKQKEKHSIRDAWQSIVENFNGHPNVPVHRNLIQIQKFWLNARLRKQYPSKATKDIKPRATIQITNKMAARKVPSLIKCEPEYSLPTKVSSDSTENIVEYQEIEQPQLSISNPNTIETLEESTEAHQVQQNRIQQDTIQEQKHQITSNQSQQQINVDHISTEKLTLNDLLQFKNARPQEDIIFQIKQPDGRSITLPAQNRITVPRKQSIYEQIMSEIKAQSHIQVQPYQEPLQITEELIEHQYNAQNPMYYTTQNQSHAPTPLKSTDTAAGNPTVLVVPESFEDKFNYFKLKEIELRHKEVQLLSEQKRIELAKMLEDLRHKQEMHGLQVEEMQIKLRILCEEEKQLTIKAS